MLVEGFDCFSGCQYPDKSKVLHCTQGIFWVSFEKVPPPHPITSFPGLMAVCVAIDSIISLLFLYPYLLTSVRLAASFLLSAADIGNVAEMEITILLLKQQMFRASCQHNHPFAN